jgi:hypothetical protein
MKIGCFKKPDNFNDNLPIGSLPSENQLFKNLKSYHLKIEGDNFLGYKKKASIFNLGFSYI